MTAVVWKACDSAGGNGVNLLLHWQNKAEQLYSTGIYSCAFSTAFAVCGEGGREFQMLIHCQDRDVDALLVCKWDFRTSVPPGLTDNSVSLYLMPAQQKPVWGCSSWGFSMSISQFFHGSCGVRLVGKKQAVISLICSQRRSHGQPDFQPLIRKWCRPGMSLHRYRADTTRGQDVREWDGDGFFCAGWAVGQAASVPMELQGPGETHRLELHGNTIVSLANQGNLIKSYWEREKRVAGGRSW